MTNKFLYTVNGDRTANLVDTPSSYEANIRRIVSLIREPDRSTLSLARLPDGQSYYDLSPENAPTTFLQAAGTASAMTIEWRRLDDDGVERLYTVGHEGARPGEPDVRIEFFGGTRSTLIHPTEVFDATEAGDILVEYFHTLAVPASYVLREFDLTWPKP